jgi:hypothetical protein
VKVVALGMAGLLLVLALLVAWVAWDAVRARDSLEQAARGVSTLQADAVGGRAERLDATVADLQQHEGLWRVSEEVGFHPGKTVSVTYAIIAGKHQGGDVILRTTPGP